MITYLASFLGLSLAAWRLNWLDAFHLAGGCLLLAVPVLALWLYRAWRRRGDELGLETEDQGSADPWLRQLLFGLIGAALGTAYLNILGFPLLERVPGLYAGYYDRDRPRLEQRLASLESTGNYAQAAETIRGRIGARLSSAWAVSLNLRLVDDLTRAAQNATSPQQRIALLSQALAVAHEHGLDDRLATILHAEAVEARDVNQRIDELRAQERWPELVDELRILLRKREPIVDRSTIASQLYDALVAWGMTSASPGEKARLFREAKDLAIQHGLSSATVESLLKEASHRLALIDSELTRRRSLEEERTRPLALPKGARSGLVRVITDLYPPIIVAEFWLEDTSGAFISGLQAKDVRVRVDGRPASVLALSSLEPRMPMLNIVLALDISNSTSGAPLESAKEGISAFLKGLAIPRREVRILAFSDQVYSVCPWTSDFQGAIHQVSNLQANGKTALLQSIRRAIEDLKGREGQRRLILFTDGQDTVGGADLASLLLLCRSEQIVIDCLGLKSDTLDLAVLTRLSQETGGSTIEIAHPEGLVEQFRAMSRGFHKSLYRMAIAPEAHWTADTQSLPIEILVGRTEGNQAMTLVSRSAGPLKTQ